MRILKLSGYFYPEQISSSHLTRDLQEAYLDAGFTFVNYVPTPSRGVSDAVREEYKKRRYEEYEDGRVIVHRFSMFREGKNPIQRALRYVLVNVKQYFRGRRAKGIDLILSGSTPPTQGLLCGLVKKKLKVPFVYNLQDIFPDSLVNARMTKKGSLIWKIGRKIEDFTYRSADKIIVISEGFKRNIMEKGVPEEKIVVIPNWVDATEVYPVPREENVLFARYGLDPSRFYVCYSGNIGHSQNLPLLLETARILHDELPRCCFVLIGAGAAKAELEKAIAQQGIDNIILLPFQPYEIIAHGFSLGDAGLVISKPGIGGSSVPSKTWSIMAAQRPVIASFDADSELFQLVQEQNVGMAVPAGDARALTEAIKAIEKDPEGARAMGERGRQYVVNNLSREKCTAMYVQTVREAAQQQ